MFDEKKETPYHWLFVMKIFWSFFFNWYHISKYQTKNFICLDLWFNYVYSKKGTKKNVNFRTPFASSLVPSSFLCFYLPSSTEDGFRPSAKLPCTTSSCFRDGGGARCSATSSSRGGRAFEPRPPSSRQQTHTAYIGPRRGRLQRRSSTSVVRSAVQNLWNLYRLFICQGSPENCLLWTLYVTFSRNYDCRFYPSPFKPSFTMC